jgi:multidrug efflux system outer membrane protein
MTKTLVSLLLGASALTACAAGPDYVRPEAPSTAAAPFIGGVSIAIRCSTGSSPMR